MTNNHNYLNEMLHLTADIAEELLTLKDTGLELGDETTEKIARLAELAITCRANDSVNAISDISQAGRNNLEQSDTSAIASPAIETSNEVKNELQIESLIDDDPEAQINNIEDDESCNTQIDNELIQNEHSGNSSDITRDTECQCVDENTKAEIADSAIEEVEALADTLPAESVSEISSPRKRNFTVRELRNVFTLNDVFLFQRTLFHGSSSEFKKALEEIASFSSIKDLERYLEDIHGVDLSSPEAELFINTVQTFFQ